MAIDLLASPGKQGSASTRGSVLVVDDEDLVRRAITRVLERSGQQVVAVDGAAAALGVLASGNVDAVVSDITMPGMSGLELLAAIRERDGDVPVILVTGAPTLDTAVGAMAYGVFDYVTKPMFERLAETTARAVGLSRLGRLKRAAMEAAGARAGAALDLAELTSAFGRAMSSLWPAYQPIIDREGLLFGHEALLRAREPSLPHPGAVIDAAERLGMLDELGTRMRDLSAEAVLGTADAGVLFVNLHPRDLDHPSLMDAETPLGSMASRVVLEITERSSLTGNKGVRARVAQLRELGYRIAVDDLGAGYAGLTSFALLEPEVVKLDMTLVRDVDTDTTKQKVIASFTSLSHDLGMRVVAEGIETAAELRTTRDLGCDLFQGFALARPGPAFPSFLWPLSSCGA